MKAIFTLALAAAAAAGAVPAMAQVSATIGINQPGVYGRIRIGDVPPPALYRSEPVLIAPPPRRVAAPPQPVYLYVPPAHQQNWRRYCGQYRACGQPVYFVRDEWVRERYEREHPGWNRGRHRGWDKHDGRHDDGPGRGHGKDKHKEKGKHGGRD